LQTPEGRLLCFLLALYAFSVFGYVTAALATFFDGQDADTDRQKDELREILAELRRLRRELPTRGNGGEGGEKTK
jgi:voltage-gated potassium channel